MKKLLLLLLILFVNSNQKTFAEYNGLQVEMIIEMNDGSKIHAYNFIAPFNLNDTLEEYLENNHELILRNDFNDSIGDFTYHTNRVSYRYNWYEASVEVYQLLNKVKADYESIKSVEIISVFNYSYAVGMSGINSLDDTIWSDKPAVLVKSFGGQLCSHDIFIHEQNENTKSVIQKLEKATANSEAKRKAFAEVLKNLDGEEYYRVLEEYESIEEELDNVISNILRGFNAASKVIIVTWCSC